jgi:hypothetical protein
MKQKLFLAVLFAICLFPFTHVKGQQEIQAKDKFTLLTMPYNERPLTLYKGQFQVNASYRLGVRAKSYDSNGEKISLKQDGSASVLHGYLLEIKYGITDFIELGADSYFMKNGIRSESYSFLNSATEIINTNSLKEFKGIGDLTIAASIRPPISYKVYDISLRGGITLPVASYKPSEPTHNITEYKSPNSFTVNYHFNNNNGIGVPVYFFSGAAKFTFSKISLEARGTYNAPMKEGENIRWEWTLNGSTFTYYSTPYSYLPDRLLLINGAIHYQAVGWFDLFLTSYFTKTSSGWTEHYNGKYANPETSLFTIEPGFELQITPSLTVYQFAGIRIAGKNVDAPFYLLTTISFNMFPFLK